MESPPVQHIRNWIQERLLELTDEDYGKKLSVFTPDVKQALGVPVPDLRNLARQANISLKIQPETWVHYLSLVAHDRVREEIIIGAVGLGRRASRLDDLFGEKVSGWARELDNWETTDQLSIPVGSWVLADLSRIGYLEAWTVHGETVWKKRLGVVTTVQLNHGGQSHPDETLRVVRNVMTTNESTLIKAVGWAVREVKDVEAVEHFLEEWAPRISKTLLTEATRKLPEGSRKKIRALA